MSWSSGKGEKVKEAATNTGAIARSAGTVSIAVMCSRVLGLVREQAFAVLFGAGFAYDSFVVAFRIPNLLRDLFGEGALSSAFVAVFTDYDTNRDAAQTWRLANNVLAFFAVMLSLITIAGILCAEPLVLLLVDADFELVANKVALTSMLTMIMFPFLIFISLAAVVMGILNSKGHFFVPALSSSFFNMGSIVGGVSLAYLLPKFGQPAIMGMAIGTLIGGFLQLACQVPLLKKTGFVFRPVLDLRHPGLLRILKLMVPAVIGLSATQLNIFINTYFASSCPEGSLSWLNYAFRLVQLPIGVFGVAISVASLPVLARFAARKDMHNMRETYASSLVMAFCLTIPATIGLFLLGEHIIRLIFQYGSFTAADTLMTAQALAFYSLGLLAYAAVKITVPVFYALNDTRYPVIGSFIAVAVNICMILATIDMLQHRAMALSISCAMTANFLFLGAVLYRKLSGYSLSYLSLSLCKIIVAAAVMAVWVLAVEKLLADWMQSGFLGSIVGLLSLILSAALLYGGVLYLVQLKELTLIVEKVRARVRG